MEKSILLESIHQCIEACENLATASTHAVNKKMCNDCLNQAIDCADAGMVLIIKLNEEPEGLHRNLFKQFISYCKECLSACDKYNDPQALRAVLHCRKSMEYCQQYVTEHVHVDQYTFVSPSQSRQSYTERWKHALSR